MNALDLGMDELWLLQVVLYKVGGNHVKFTYNISYKYIIKLKKIRHINSVKRLQVKQLKETIAKLTSKQKNACENHLKGCSKHESSSDINDKLVQYGLTPERAQKRTFDQTFPREKFAEYEQTIGSSFSIAKKQSKVRISCGLIRVFILRNSFRNFKNK